MAQSQPQRQPVDGNEAVARSAYAFSEVIAIYPITPASNVGECCDDWATQGRTNIFGTVPAVVEMQSEAGAAGTAHGAVSAGALAATCTASQGLLLKLPVLYKIAGELSPFVVHVAARAVATHALSIFGDHSDVMAARGTGMAMLASASVQEAHDLAAIAHLASLETRVPFLHFYDGFRTSHEIHKIDLLSEEDYRALLDEDSVQRHRERALDPQRPTLRGTAQNPDVFFQSREAGNPFYDAAPAKTQAVMERFAARTGRAYRLFEYYGHPQARRVLVLMGSGAGAAQEAADALNGQGKKVGVLQVRLYRPFDAEAFLKALPASVESLAVLDRCKEPGAPAEPLCLDVAMTLQEAWTLGRASWPRLPRVSGGRYGLSSREFTPAMAAAVFAELSRQPNRARFTVGIRDDVTRLSLLVPDLSTESPETTRAVFFGQGADGTVGANKNTIKIIAESTPLHAQGYFVYDSKKAGSVTVSHLRFGPRPIRSTYLIRQAQFVACHAERLLERIDVLGLAAPGATFLLNAVEPELAFDRLPRQAQQALIDKQLKFYAIDAYAVSEAAGLGRRINTVMQVCFFEITRLLPGYLDLIKSAIRKSYGGKSAELVERNFQAVDHALAHLRQVPVPAQATSTRPRGVELPASAPEFVRRFTQPLLNGQGEDLPVSAMPVDGAFPTDTARWEKRAIALQVPAWDPAVCIQCGKCALVCPHATIRAKAYPAPALQGAPEDFLSLDWRGAEQPAGTKFTIQVAPEDCTGCGLCVEACPARNKHEAKRKAINMTPLSDELRAREKRNFEFFLGLPEPDRAGPGSLSVRTSQLLRPLFEFSGACAGCGETPYIKLATQLFGDRLLLANATGCSSIYGGNLPTTPFARDQQGRGPAWSNSLFEDNAEFGLGLRLAVDAREGQARTLLRRLASRLGPLAQEALAADQASAVGVEAQRQRVARLRELLDPAWGPEARGLLGLLSALVRQSVWIIGGDGWAYDIGYGGLDHVVRSGARVRLLVLDTEVYSNTGGQQSKATPRGAVARFAAAGKSRPRKDFALLAASYGDAYVARVAFGANDGQTLRAFQEAEAYPGPALIVAYSTCIAHGYDLACGLEQQKLAVASGYWPLFRYDPARLHEGKNPLQLDSGAPKIPLQDYIYRETRYRMLAASRPEKARRLLSEAQEELRQKWRLLEHLAKLDYAAGPAPQPQGATP